MCVIRATYIFSIVIYFRNFYGGSTKDLERF